MEALQDYGSQYFLIITCRINYVVSDAGCFQIRPNFEANFKSSACHDTIVCVEIIKNADQVFGTTVEKIQYENYKCYLSESQTSIERWLGLWKWYLFINVRRSTLKIIIFFF